MNNWVSLCLPPETVQQIIIALAAQIDKAIVIPQMEVK